MALSGSTTVKVTSYDNLVFSWTATQSVADNASTIAWTMSIVTTDKGRIDSSLKKNWKVIVNGVTYSGTNYIAVGNNSTKTLASGTTVIEHNADGTKSFSYSFTQQIEVTFSGSFIDTKSGSGSATLDQIPRQATITNAPNFTDEDNPVITYSNLAGEAVDALQACISFDGTTANIAYRDISKTDTSYTFSLTTAERNVIRNNMTTVNSKTVYFIVRTTIGTEVFYSNAVKTVSIINANPTLSLTAVDSNSATIALTGSNSKLVRYFSNVNYTLTASALKSASISSRKVTLGSNTLTTATGTFSNVTTGTVSAVVTDSRGNSSTKSVTLTMANYVKLTCAIDVTTPTASGTATLKISGNYFSGSFGSTNNTITLKYRRKSGSGSYGSWVTVTPTISGTTYTATISLTGLDYNTAYTFQANAVDKLMNVSSAEKAVKASPVFYWNSSSFIVSNALTAASAAITNAISAASATISGNITAGSATITAALSTASATISGNIKAGSATVTGALSAASAAITNAVTAASATISGNITAGSATVTGALTAGATTLSSLTVTGTVDIEPDWTYPTVPSGITTEDSSLGGGRLRYRKIGKRVYVAGGVSNVKYAGSSITLFTLPEGYRPATSNFYSLRACSGTRVTRIYVGNSGTFNIEWIKNISDGSNHTSATWVDCNIDFWID